MKHRSSTHLRTFFRFSFDSRTVETSSRTKRTKTTDRLLLLRRKEPRDRRIKYGEPDQHKDRRTHALHDEGTAPLGEKNARAGLDYLKKRAEEAGLGGAHVMTTSDVSKELAEKIGIDSTTVYSWNDGTWDKIQSSEPNLKYRDWMAMATALWDRKNSIGLTYFPNVTVGWDTNPRYPAEKFAPMVTGSNPEDFEKALRMAKDWLDKNAKPGMPKLLTINSWNEWTEGTYLEPDEENGYAYLNAIARVFMGQ